MCLDVLLVLKLIITIKKLVFNYFNYLFLNVLLKKIRVHKLLKATQ